MADIFSFFIWSGQSAQDTMMSNSFLFHLLLQIEGLWWCSVPSGGMSSPASGVISPDRGLHATPIFNSMLLFCYRARERTERAKQNKTARSRRSNLAPGWSVCHMPTLPCRLPGPSFPSLSHTANLGPDHNVKTREDPQTLWRTSLLDSCTLLSMETEWGQPTSPKWL